MVYDAVNEEFLAADDTARILQHDLESQQNVIIAEDGEGQSSSASRTCEKLATKFFTYMAEDQGASFRQVSEQEVFISSEVQSSAED